MVDTRAMMHHIYDENAKIINAYYAKHSGFEDAHLPSYSLNAAVEKAAAEMPDCVDVQFTNGDTHKIALSATISKSNI